MFYEQIQQEKADFKAQSDYFTKSDVKARGWTDSAIATFLGEPDKKTKGRYSKSPPTQLFLKSRVEEVEQTEGFKKWHESTQTRRRKASEQMKKRMDAEREKTRKWINSFTIKIPKMPESKLFEEACFHYTGNKSEHLESRGVDFPEVDLPDPETCDRSFLYRITVNFLRHEYTPYDNTLDKAAGKIGVDEARFLMRVRVLDKIAEVYPFLKDECERQKTTYKHQ